MGIFADPLKDEKKDGGKRHYDCDGDEQFDQRESGL